MSDERDRDIYNAQSDISELQSDLRYARGLIDTLREDLDAFRYRLEDIEDENKERTDKERMERQTRRASTPAEVVGTDSSDAD